MVHLTHKDIVNKLSALEYIIGPHPEVLFRLPEGYQIHSSADLKRLANLILNHLEMYDYSADICITHNGKEAGFVNLNEGKSFTIYVDESSIFDGYSYNYDGACQVVAHEICHKLLLSRGFYLPDTKENEVFTDLTTIYVGLGILTLNGCFSSSVRINGNRYTVHSRSIGYLSQSDFAYAYALTNALYQTNKSIYLKGLLSTP